MANSVDLAIQELRKLQSHIFNPKMSQNDLFEATNNVIKYMEDASQEINTNYEEISRKLTEQFNTGKVQK